MSRLPIKPGVFVQNVRNQPQSIEGVNTSTAAFLGETQIGATTPTLVTSWLEFQSVKNLVEVFMKQPALFCPGGKYKGVENCDVDSLI
jgi:phage tail sheath protein FI